MEENKQKTYKLVTMLMAPEGSYWTERSHDDKWTTFYPAMYVSVWQDEEGMVYNIPLYSEHLTEGIEIYDNDIQYFVERQISEKHALSRCLTCKEFLFVIRGFSKEKTVDMMESICDWVINGEIKTTLELRNYFKYGEWGNLRELDNDGTLEQGWQEELLTPEGTAK